MVRWVLRIQDGSHQREGNAHANQTFDEYTVVITHLNWSLRRLTRVDFISEKQKAKVNECD